MIGSIGKLVKSNIIKNPNAKKIFSIVWGLGLAFIIFKRTCKGKQCVIVNSNVKEIQTKTYKNENGKCMKFTPHVTKC